MRFAWASILGLLVATGCSVPHGPFQYLDVEKLSVGESSREEVERRLGPPTFWSAHSAIHRSGSFTASPGVPLLFVAWPIYRGSLVRRCVVTVWYDARSIVSEGTVTLDLESLDEFFLLFSYRHVEYSLSDDLVEPLRRIEQRGFKIQIAEGDRHFALKTFLERRSPP